MASKKILSQKIKVAAVRGLQKAQTKNKNLLDWIKEIGITIRGQPFSFQGHEYLREIYEKHADNMVFMKGAQVGISTYHLLKALWLCDTRVAKVIYFFPTDRDVSDFSNDRAKPLLEENDYLRQRVTGIDNVGLKQLGTSSIYFRGMVSRMKVKSVDADFIILDELDECPPDNLKFAFDRLLHSQLRWKSQLSQPSVPDFGIHREFLKSDQRVWAMQCGRCNKWNFFNPNEPNKAIEFAEKFLRPINGTYCWHCIYCGKPLEIKHQQWIPLSARSKIRGYHLTQIYSTIIPPQEIAEEIAEAKEKKTARIRVFNSIFGIPYTDEIRQPITDEIIQSSQGEFGFLSESNLAYMGVDVGDTLHIVIGQDLGDKIQVIYLESTEDWGRLKTLMAQYSIWLCIIDAMPYKASAKQFAREFPERVILQYFKGSREERGNEIEKKEEDGLVVIRIGRTESLDDTTDSIRQGKIIFPNPGKLSIFQLNAYETFKNHLKNLIKDFKEDEKGNKWFEYKHNVENHYGMALNSMRLAIEYTRQFGRRFYGAGAAWTRINL
jgi:hypothetical protein